MGRIVDTLASKPVSSPEYLAVLKVARNDEIREAAARMEGDRQTNRLRLIACRRELRRRGR